jgi:hypothetical protein
VSRRYSDRSRSVATRHTDELWYLRLSQDDVICWHFQEGAVRDPVAQREGGVRAGSFVNGAVWYRVGSVERVSLDRDTS